MISPATTETIATTLLFLGAYCVSATLSEAIQARLAAFFGDSTAADEGWASWNPMDHIDLLGVLFVVILGFGLVRGLPLNSVRMRLFPRDFRFILVYFSPVLVNLGIALLALSILLASFKTSLAAVAIGVSTHNAAPLSSITQQYPELTSGAIVLALFLGALVTYAALAAAISVIAHGFRYALLRIRGIQEENFNLFFSQEPTLWLSTILLLVLFCSPLKCVFLHVITGAALCVDRLLGVL